MIPAPRVDHEWVVRAACASGDPELWFPTVEHDPRIRDAKLACAACPVWRDCLEEALTSGEHWGIRAGLTPRERRRILRRAQRATVPA